MKRPTLNQRILAFSRELLEPYNYQLDPVYSDSLSHKPWRRITCTIELVDGKTETLDKAVVVGQLVKAINSHFKNELYKPCRLRNTYHYDTGDGVTNTLEPEPWWFVYWIIKSTWVEMRESYAGKHTPGVQNS